MKSVSLPLKKKSFRESARGRWMMELLDSFSFHLPFARAKRFLLLLLLLSPILWRESFQIRPASIWRHCFRRQPREKKIGHRCYNFFAIFYRYPRTWKKKPIWPNFYASTICNSWSTKCVKTLTFKRGRRRPQLRRASLRKQVETREEKAQRPRLESFANTGLLVERIVSRCSETT